MIVLLGSTGMLGSMLAKTLKGEVRALSRPEFNAEKITYFAPNGRVVNCVGLIKPYCENVQRAIQVNALFPYLLPKGSIQIATDCVYSGSKGAYTETDPHDATDVYGKTKSLGEAPQLNNLRCSIIGPEEKNHLSLLDWFLSQEGEVKGFTNHYWNGITTYHFAKIVQGIIDEGIELPEVQHIVPANVVTKAYLLAIIRNAYNKDIKVVPVKAPQAVDRTLATNNPTLNNRLWKAAGYDEPPTIEQMVRELAEL